MNTSNGNISGRQSGDTERQQMDVSSNHRTEVAMELLSMLNSNKRQTIEEMKNLQDQQAARIIAEVKNTFQTTISSILGNAGEQFSKVMNTKLLDMKRSRAIDSPSRNSQKCAITSEGSEILFNRRALAWSLSVWICERASSDMIVYNSNEPVASHIGVMSVILFGIPRKWGLSRYGTPLGIELRRQATEVISRIMWQARCDTNCVLFDSIPPWIYSFVPICRRLFRSRNRTNEGDNFENIMRDIGTDGSSTSETTRDFLRYEDIFEQNAAWKKERTLFKSAVENGIQLLEEKRKEYPRKTPKLSMHNAIQQRVVNEEMEEAVTKITAGADAGRRHLSQFLSFNRNKFREFFFESLGFILYAFEKFGVGEARKKGFDAIMREMSEKETLGCNSVNEFNNLVGAPRTRVGTDTRSSDSYNMGRVRDAVKKFPSFSVIIKYNVTVVSGTKNSSRNEAEREAQSRNLEDVGTREESLAPTEVCREDTIHLHMLSLNLLSELVRAESWEGFLGSSKKSLIAVHMFAICLRGLICRCIGSPCSVVESSAIRNVYLTSQCAPTSCADTYSIMLFSKSETNDNRLISRLKIAKKQYLHEESSARKKALSTRVFENDMEEDDCIFFCPLNCDSSGTTANILPSPTVI